MSVRRTPVQTTSIQTAIIENNVVGLAVGCTDAFSEVQTVSAIIQQQPLYNEHNTDFRNTVMTQHVDTTDWFERIGCVVEFVRCFEYLNSTDPDKVMRTTHSLNYFGTQNADYLVDDRAKLMKQSNLATDTRLQDEIMACCKWARANLRPVTVLKRLKKHEGSASTELNDAKMLWTYHHQSHPMSPEFQGIIKLYEDASDKVDRWETPWAYKDGKRLEDKDFRAARKMHLKGTPKSSSVKTSELSRFEAFKKYLHRDTKAEKDEEESKKIAHESLKTKSARSKTFSEPQSEQVIKPKSEMRTVRDLKMNASAGSTCNCETEGRKTGRGRRGMRKDP